MKTQCAILPFCWPFFLYREVCAILPFCWPFFLLNREVYWVTYLKFPLIYRIYRTYQQLDHVVQPVMNQMIVLCANCKIFFECRCLCAISKWFFDFFNASPRFLKSTARKTIVVPPGYARNKFLAHCKVFILGHSWSTWYIHYYICVIGLTYNHLCHLWNRNNE